MKDMKMCVWCEDTPVTGDEELCPICKAQINKWYSNPEEIPSSIKQNDEPLEELEF